MTKYLLKLFLNILLFSQLLSCEKINKMENKFAWSVETVADYGYPMKIKSGAFYDEKGEVIAGIPADMFLSLQWWSGSSGAMVVGEQYRPVPNSMQIKWFSYAEDKFYEGTFQLNKEKISVLFKKGISCKDMQEDENFTDFKVAIAPGGQVFLYLNGYNALLVGAYQAQEIIVNDLKKEMGYTIDETRKESFEAYIKKMTIESKQ